MTLPAGARQKPAKNGVGVDAKPFASSTRLAPSLPSKRFGPRDRPRKPAQAPSPASRRRLPPAPKPGAANPERAPRVLGTDRGRRWLLRGLSIFARELEEGVVLAGLDRRKV